MLLGEFGAPAQTTNVKGYMDTMYKWLNNNFHAGTHWNYTPTWRADTRDGWNMEGLSIVDDTGQLRDNFRPRAHPIAVADNPMNFTETKTSMKIHWNHDTARGTTELYIPVTPLCKHPVDC